ncbi:glycoside hydrolase family 92 protein [Ginsengibacter hankyongi]|uniref:Glycoside hydrolase family 92 protein n=1 Tax=Ginsengibacter hankyongi TaxID=2607284 RepID=A0A5J5IIQ7_9BACT|nr:GH92 family glycosyl hydrolase [Ginsengibacter hankyongi]KAA9040910.1 glycoside hydrolase family 92 protein [Ginsengibacter hankyongi]
MKIFERFNLVSGKRRFFGKYLLLLFFLVNFCFRVGLSQSAVSYVNPYIGTGGHGHVFLGANVPFGAVQLGPVNISEGWDWCSGYNYADSTIIGFSHTHLSGTGIGDLGDILVMPTTGELIINKGSLKAPGNFSLFSHADEKVSPGYYSVNLKRYNIKAELTASTRVGFHRYTFPASQQSHIIIDLVQGIGWDMPVYGYIKKINDSTIAGYRFSKGWAQDQRIYFAAVFSKPFKNIRLFKNREIQPGDVAMSDSVKAAINFTTNEGETIDLKVGISPVSMENAMLNINTEIPGWDFDAIKNNAAAAWDRELSKVIVKTNDAKAKEIFYTALYHSFIAPSVFNDVNGDYYGTDKEVHRNASFTNLTTFSLWDTYRCENSLLTMLQPERVSDIVNSMLAIYQQQGKLPVWHLMANETNTMPGNSATQVIADAYLKGIKGFDTALAYEAVKATAILDERGMKYVKKYGFIPADSMTESVASGMEYAIADGCTALMAKRMGKEDDYQYFIKRAGYYKNYFDSTTQFVRGRISSTQWREPFSPFISRHMKDDFTEGNAWQYTWLAPQDVHGLIQLLGGDKKFIKKLDSLYVVKGDMGKEASNDISGLIGQYAHGNEPSHHIAYLYVYAGQPWKTADKVRYILDSLYTGKPDGLSGNEDVGQMSAWYVMSALGFYPVHPAGGIYVFGSPLFDEATINIGNNKTFTILAKNNSPKNKYIQRVMLNNKNYTKAYLSYADIMNGGSLLIEMGKKPSSKWGAAVADRP